MGQPAALMISNNCFPSYEDGRHFSLRKSFQQGNSPHKPGALRHAKRSRRLSTFPVDKDVH